MKNPLLAAFGLFFFAASALADGIAGGVYPTKCLDLSDAGTACQKPAPSGPIVGTTDSQTLTNKTLTAPVISSISNGGTITVPSGTDTLVGRATPDTLINKSIDAGELTGSLANVRLQNAGVTPINGKNCTLGSACTVGNYAICSDGTGYSPGATTSETLLTYCAIPANTLTANGCLILDLMWDYTNSSNNKTLKAYLNTSAAIGGTAFYSQTATTTLASHVQVKICGRNSTGSQIGGLLNGLFSAGAAFALTTSSVDMTATSYIVFSGTKASSGESLTLEQFQVINAPF